MYYLPNLYLFFSNGGFDSLQTDSLTGYLSVDIHIEDILSASESVTADGHLAEVAGQSRL